LASTELAPQAPVVAPAAKAPLRGKPDLIQRRLARLGWGFTAPALIFIAAVTIFPIVFAIVLSFENVNVTANGFQLNGATLSNYHTVLTAGLWHHALWFTTYYTVISVIIEVVLGTMFALVLERLTRFRGMMMAILLIPWSLITVISAELWGYIYNATYGVLDDLSHIFGTGEPVVLGTPLAATVALIFADVWKTTPFVAIIVLAGLVMLPQELYEASEVDGASGWKTFWTITLPLLRPTLGIAVLFRILQAFGIFDLPYVLTGGGPGNSTTSLAILGYNTLFLDLDFGPGAAVATTTALIILLMCIIFLRVFKTQVGKEAVGA
jgi:multiple sugar transport system permease protein